MLLIRLPSRDYTASTRSVQGWTRFCRAAAFMLESRLQMVGPTTPSAQSRGIYFVAIAVALCLLSACGSSEVPSLPGQATRAAALATITPIPTPTPPPGWRIFSKQGFQIALPPRWQEIRLDEASLRTAIQAAQDNNPPLADALGTLLQTGQYKTLLLYATATVSAPTLQNVAIARVSVPRDTRIETIAQAYAGALPDAVRGSKLVEVVQSLPMNGLDAAEIIYEVSLISGDGQLVTLRGVQYLFLTGPEALYVVTISGDKENSSALIVLARDMAGSFVAR